MSNKKQTSVIAAGFALFSMFFGAGDLIWPLIIGGDSGDMNFWTVSGFLITAVSLPLLGLCAMMLFMGDYYAFFARLGRIPAAIVIFIVQVIVGPVGSIPRLYTLAYATLQPYLSTGVTLFGFSLVASLIVIAFTLKKQRVVDILGLVLTPLLLISIIAIVAIGWIGHPSAPASSFTPSEAFSFGLVKGYNTLDLIASFIFAPMVLAYFCTDSKGIESEAGRRGVARKMVQASLIAAGLLSLMYISMTYVAAFYVPTLPEGIANEARLSAIAMHLLGAKGAFIACVAVTLACLTTAIPLTAIAADYVKRDVFNERLGTLPCLFIVLTLSLALANLGFMGIASMLEPVLKMLCPALIVLSLLNIVEKMYQVPARRAPVFAAFGISTLQRFAEFL